VSGENECSDKRDQHPKLIVVSGVGSAKSFIVE
jgi:hypothetical protein